MRWLLFVALLAGALAGAAVAQSNRYPRVQSGGGGAATVITVVSSQAVVVGQSPYKVLALGTPRGEWAGAPLYLGSGPTTVGGRFFLAVASKVTGANFWWDSGAVIPTSVKCSLWDVDGATRVASVTISPVVQGINACIFASPPTVLPYHRYEITMFAGAAGYSYYTSADGQVLPVFPLPGGLNFVWLQWNRWSGGDQIPDSNAVTERYPIEPTFAPAVP